MVEGGGEGSARAEGEGGIMLHLQSRRLLKPLVELLLCSSNRCGQCKVVICGKSCRPSLLSSRWQGSR